MVFVSLYERKNGIKELAPFIRYLPGEDPEILMQKNYVGIGCLVEGQTIGIILARVNTDERIAELVSFYVEDGFRSKGVGAELMNKLIRKLIRKKVVFLSVKLSIPEDRAGYLWYLKHGFYFVFDECKRYEIPGNELTRFMEFQNIPGGSKLEKALSTKKLSETNIRCLSQLTKKELGLTEQGPAKKYIKNHKDALLKCDKDASLVYMKNNIPITVALVSKSADNSYDIDYIDFSQGRILECIYTVYCTLKKIVKNIASDEKISFMAATDFSEKLFRKHIEYAPDDVIFKESTVVNMTRLIGNITDSP